VARPDEIGVSVSYPLPGTRFYELVKEQLRSKTHWHESNDLDMMFHGTYNSEFYRAVRNLLHRQVDEQTSAVASEQNGSGRHFDSLAERWQDLLAQEGTFRSGGAATYLASRA
jgi:anaerobic magnesium-protoporphyrin IX monomethyl ester cyclase